MIISPAASSDTLPGSAGKHIQSSGLNSITDREKPNRAPVQVHKTSRRNPLVSNQKTARRAFVPFQYLALPPEIQNRIYELVYSELSTLTIDEDCQCGSMHFSKSWPSNLHLASRKNPTRRRCCCARSFSGHLRFRSGPAHRFNYNGSYDELRSQATKLTFFDFTPANMNWRTFGRDEWDNLDLYFPNVKEIHVEWTRTAYKFVMGSHEETQAWQDLWKPGAFHAFLTNRRENETEDFDYPTAVKRLKLHHLSSVMNTPSRRCTIFVTGILQWLAYRQKQVYLQVRLRPFSYNTLESADDGTRKSKLDCSETGGFQLSVGGLIKFDDPSEYSIANEQLHDEQVASCEDSGAYSFLCVC